MPSTPAPESIPAVPNKPRTGRRHRSIPLQEEEWVPAEVIANRMGTTRTAAIEAFLQWWLRVPGAKLPERPSADLVREVAPWLMDPDSDEGTPGSDR